MALLSYRVLCVLVVAGTLDSKLVKCPVLQGTVRSCLLVRHKARRCSVDYLGSSLATLFCLNCLSPSLLQRLSTTIKRRASTHGLDCHLHVRDSCPHHLNLTSTQALLMKSVLAPHS